MTRSQKISALKAHFAEITVLTEAERFRMQNILENASDEQLMEAVYAGIRHVSPAAHKILDRRGYQ